MVLVYPTDEAKTDSEETRKVMKQVLAPKMTGIQIRGLKKLQKGGIAIETGNKIAAHKVREMAAKTDIIKCSVPRRVLPKFLIYDVD